MNYKPPRIAEKILSKLQYDDVWKTTLGDFEEYYQHLLAKKGRAHANRWYWNQVLRYAPSKIIHKLYWSSEMFKNYLKVAYRSISKNKSYSFINIFGLGIGLASFLMIGIYINQELSYDDFHEDSDQIYRIVRQIPDSRFLGTNWYGVSQLPLSIALSDNFSGIESSTAFGNDVALIKIKNDSFYKNGISTDTDFFDIFSAKWVSGNPNNAFDSPESVVITRSFASKHLGSESAIGKPLLFSSYGEEFKLKTITGVIEDNPENSLFTFDYIIPRFSITGYAKESISWTTSNVTNFIKISESVDPVELESQIEALANSKVADDEYYKSNPDMLPKYSLQPLGDVHLKSTNINFNSFAVSDIIYIYMLSAIALVILIIACANYMNLATARSMARAKEVGIRKVNGAFRSNIMMQFTAEAVIFSSIGIVVALIFLFLLLPSFSGLVDRDFNSRIFLKPMFWAVLIGTGLFVGLIAGSYPAFFMSALKPVGIFNNQMKGGSGNRRLRNTLVVGQFAITNILIVSSIVIFKQLDFIKNNDVGFNREQVLTVDLKDPNLRSQYEVLKQLLLANPSITAVSSGEHLPTSIRNRTSSITWEGEPDDSRISVYTSDVNYNYIDLMDVEIIAGRSPSFDYSSDTGKGYIINETAAKTFGWTPEEAVGKNFNLGRAPGSIIGVVKDFNFLSYHLGIDPLVLKFNNLKRHNHLLIKVMPENLPQTIAFVEKEMKTLSPDYPFEYAFLDDIFNNMYQTELTLGRIFNYLTILALFIACMGLFGLASFITQQRTKEIGVRKILGANIFQIVALLNKDFLKLIGISFLISFPISWFLSNNWLESFAYKTTIEPIIFMITASIAFGIALLSVSYKSIRTAVANPVDSLKAE